MKKAKQAIAMLLAIVMVLQGVPVTAFADLSAANHPSSSAPAEVPELILETTPEPQPPAVVPSAVPEANSTVPKAPAGDSPLPENSETSVFGSAPVLQNQSVQSGTVIEQGTCGTALTWTLDTQGVLRISGIGAMTDYTSASPWKGRSDITSLIIEEGVTSVGKSSFTYLYSLQSVQLPSTLTSIGDHAFQHCSKLNGTLILPGSVAYVGKNSFQDCPLLSGVTMLPADDPSIVKIIELNAFSRDKALSKLELCEGVTEIRDAAFSYCPLDQGVRLPDSLITLGNSAFAHSNLTSIRFGSSLKSIGSNAFEGCAKLTGDLSFPGSLTFIGPSAFKKCTGLTGISLTGSLTAIDSYVFQGCSSLTKVTLPAGLTDIGRYAFDGCSNLPEIVLPQGTSLKNDYIFRGCTSLAKVTLPAGLTDIGTGVFQNCSSLTRVTLPAGLTSIGSNAFDSCSALTDLALPAGLTSIGTSAFANCSGLSEVTLPNITVLPDSLFQNCTSLAKVTLPDGLTGIDGYAFAGCSSLTGITLPAGLTSMGSGVFQGCSSLTGITLPTGLTSIGSSAFQGCSSLIRIELPDGLKSIESRTFSGCSALTQIIFPDKLEMIKEKAFFNCTGLSGAIHLPDSVLSLGKGAFQNCSKVTSVTLGTQFQSFSLDGNYGYNSVFSGMTALEEIQFTANSVPENLYSQTALKDLPALRRICVPKNLFADFAEQLLDSIPDAAQLTIDDPTLVTLVENNVLVGYFGTEAQFALPDGLTGIGPMAFHGHSELTQITLPQSLTTIGQSAFIGCSKLAGTLEIPAAVTSIANKAFQNCTGLTALHIADGAPLILGNHVFAGCTGLTELKLGTGLTEIGENCFDSCSGLTSLTLPEGLTAIHSFAFYQCTGLTGQLILPESLVTLDGFSFSGCNFNGELIIPNKIASLDMENLQESGRFSSITFGTGLTSLTDSTYRYFFYGIESVTFLSEQVPGGRPERALNNMPDLKVIYVPKNSYSQYVTALQPLLQQNVRFAVIGGGDFLIENGVLQGYFGQGGQVTIPEEVTAIGPSAFSGCTTLTGITIPQGVISIGESAFSGCTALTGIVIPQSVTAIGKSAFQECYNLESVSLPDGLTEISPYTFSDCSALKHIEFPAGLTSIGAYAFSYCTQLSGSLQLPQDLTFIGEYAFSGCSELTGRLVIPNQVQLIPTGAFVSMAGLTEIVIGSGVTQIASRAFPDYYNKGIIEQVTFLGTAVPKMEFFPWENSSTLTAIYVPEESVVDYLQAIGSQSPACVRVKNPTREWIIRDGVLCAYLGSSPSVTVPDGVTTLGTNVFANHHEMTGLILPEGLTAIETAAFSKCTSLTSVRLPSSLTAIGPSAFSFCRGLTGPLVLPETVASIGEKAFYGCSGLTGDLTLPSALTSLGFEAFASCTGLNGTLTLSDSLTNLSLSSFTDTAFHTVIFGSQLTSLKSGYGVHLPTQQVVFLSDLPPRNCGKILKSAMAHLEAVYVPKSSLEAYTTELRAYLPERVRIETDLWKMGVSNLKAETFFSKSVDLVWDPHPSTSIVGYTVYRDGTKLADTTECRFADTGLTPNVTYSYAVEGHTADGQTTLRRSVSVTTVEPRLLEINTLYPYHAITELDTKILVKAANYGNLQSAGSRSPTATLYWLDGGTRRKIGTGTLDLPVHYPEIGIYSFFWDITSLPDGSYPVVCVLEDPDGTAAELESNIEIYRRIPDQLINVSAFGDESVIHINWGISTEADTESYRIYRRTGKTGDFLPLTRIYDRNTLTYADADVEKDQIYQYYVAGINVIEREGPPSAVVAATLSTDDQKPLVTTLTPSEGSVLSGTVQLSAQAEDNVDVSEIEFFYSADNKQSWTSIGTGAKLDWDTSALADGPIFGSAVARDAAGNASDPLINAWTIDNTGPAQVTGLTFESTSNSITLHWDTVADADTHHYQVEKKQADGSYQVLEKRCTALGYVDRGLAPSTDHTYRIIAVDASGNKGLPSADLTASTGTDVTAPVITELSPQAGYRTGPVTLKAVASDDADIASITLQVSTNRIDWTALTSQKYTSPAPRQSLEYQLDLDQYPEGSLLFRAVATDSAGHTSSTDDDAPFSQYLIDRTAPAAPTGVTAVGKAGHVVITWDEATDPDRNTYTVYRAEKENGPYTKLASGLNTLTYPDRSAVPEKTYFYQVQLNDLAGNSSTLSIPVSAAALADTEAPVIHSIYPSAEYKLSPQLRQISVMASDNQQLSELVLELSTDGKAYTELAAKRNLTDRSNTLSAEIPVEMIREGQKLWVRATAADSSRNQSEPVIAVYESDTTAPTVNQVTADYAEGAVTIHWISSREADLAGFRIYRKSGTDGVYSMIGQRPPLKEGTAYTWSDVNLSDTAVDYYYKVEAADSCGNTFAALSSAVAIPDTTVPVAVIACDPAILAGVEYYFDGSLSTDASKIVSYLFDFGDGTIASGMRPKHTYAEPGTYTITLMVTNDKGHQGSCTQTITVGTRENLGQVEITIVDENGHAVPNALVYFDLGTPNQTVQGTSSGGKLTMMAPVGPHTVGSIIPDNNWLPVKHDIIVNAGAVNQVTMTLIHKTLIEGKFEVHRMTFDEIVAAGIDLNDPANQYEAIVKINLTYGPEYSCVHTDSFHYNPVTGKGRTHKMEFVDEKNLQHEYIVHVPSVMIPQNFGGGSSGSFENPPALAYFDVIVGVHTLKEFFTADLHIVNNAGSEFSMIDNIIELHLPDGLSIVPTYSTEAEKTVNIAEIPGQTEEVISWILRGDAVGKYQIAADYNGILDLFHAPIEARFETVEPIEVYGLTNLSLDINISDTMRYGEVTYTTVLRNNGPIDVYRPRLHSNHSLYRCSVLDASGKDVTEEILYDYVETSNIDFKHPFSMPGTVTLATRVDTIMDVLPPGYSIVKSYTMNSKQHHDEPKLVLKNMAYEMENKYGLVVNINVVDHKDIDDGLNSGDESLRKAIATFGVSKNAFDYLLEDEQFAYWDMYACTGSVQSDLTSRNQAIVWGIIGQHPDLILDNSRAKELILEALEISLPSRESIQQQLYSEWINGLDAFIKTAPPEFQNTLEQLLLKNNPIRTKEEAQALASFMIAALANMTQSEKERQYLGYRAVYDGETLSIENKYLDDLSEEMRELSETAVIPEYDAHDLKHVVHSFLTADHVKEILSGLGMGWDVAEQIVNLAADQMIDYSLFLQAQANMDSYNLFLDALINYLEIDQSAALALPNLSEQQMLYRAATDIKATINENNEVNTLVTNLTDHTLNILINEGVDEIMDYVSVLGKIRKAIAWAGDSLLNSYERHSTADSIRYVSLMSAAMSKYLLDKHLKFNPENISLETAPASLHEEAAKYMQLLDQLCTLRIMGESLVSHFGRSWDIAEDRLTGQKYLDHVCALSSVDKTTKWSDWLHEVATRIQTARAQVMKTPLNLKTSGFKAPVVTFDYASGQTAQSFSDLYEYSLDNGATWTQCSGSPIAVPPHAATIILQVRRTSTENAPKELAASLMINGIPTVGDVWAIQTADGYRFENLDNHKLYEYTASNTAIENVYGQSLDHAVPRGSYKHAFPSAPVKFLYLRTVGDATAYASHLRQVKVYGMPSVTVNTQGEGTVTGGGRYEYNSKVHLNAVPAGGFAFQGWYEDGRQISTEPVLTLTVTANRSLTARFEKAVNDPWSLDDSTGQLTGLSESTTAQQILAHYSQMGQVTVTTPDGKPAAQAGTGCVVTINGKPYTVVVRGDVTGDAVIDIFDLQTMLAHVNAESKLTDAYLQAGCILNKKEIDIFDLNALLDYIHTGSFAQ